MGFSMKAFAFLIALAQMIFTFSTNAAEMSKAGGGSIVLNDQSYSVKYGDVVDSKGGIYRALVVANGAPALFTSGVDDIIYTLKVSGGKVLIDCAIAEARSNQTGLSIRKSMCGINKELGPDYAELGYAFTDHWKEKAARVDVSSLVMHKKTLDVVKGIVEGVEVHQVYKALSQLEGAAPVIYLKRGSECHGVSKGKVFVNYSAEDQDQPIGISILVDANRYEFESYKGGDVNQLRFGECKG